MRGRWWFAAIEPAGRPDVLALPKGLIDPGEQADATALREVREEAGIECVLDRRLGDVRYVYTRRGERVFKLVIFYLLRYRAGAIGDIAPDMRIEVARARWVPVGDRRRLSYRGERDMVGRAAEPLCGQAPGGVG
jgi:8-oxo-dGTP pyrophosphatase MutT (NUDIX family)